MGTELKVSLDVVAAAFDRSARTFMRLVLAGLLLTAVAACATPPTDPEQRQVFEETNDPLEPMNRAIFDFNVAVDKYFLTPVAQGYEFILPQLVRDSIQSFLRHLKSPIVLANDLLQGETERAGETMSRMVFNTVMGVGGLFDVAGEAGIAHHEEDFGQTLAVWGVTDGPYLMLPFLGPTNVRDGIGIYGVDRAFDPLYYASYNSERFLAEYNGPIRSVTEAIDARSRNYQDVRDLEESSLDFYAAVRSLYRQQRATLISNGEDSSASAAPSLNFEMDFDELDEEQDEADASEDSMDGEQVSLSE